jgi:hypothetical protein
MHRRTKTKGAVFWGAAAVIGPPLFAGRGDDDDSMASAGSGGSAPAAGRAGEAGPNGGAGGTGGGAVDCSAVMNMRGAPRAQASRVVAALGAVALLALGPAVACGGDDAGSSASPAGGGGQAGGAGQDAGSDAGQGAGSDEELGEGDKLYVAATETLTAGVDTARCELITQLLADYPLYATAMTNTRLRDLASSRFKPVLDFMSRKLCNEFEISGDIGAYKSEALANSPAGEFLNNTPLLQALVDRSSELDALLDAANKERSAEGLDPIIVADYPNTVTGETSTVVFFPGWPGRPRLDQWLQVQRTLGQMFFITLEPRDDGTYASYLHSRGLVTYNGMSTVGISVGNQGGACLTCHYSGKPLRMRALDDAKEAAKVATLVDYLGKYPPKTNHPGYNPFPDSPGIGTGGTLTMAAASTYAGRTLTEADLATLNRNTACDSCHNGTIQNSLIPPLSETVRMLMANGLMAPGAGIVDETERAEAIKVMKAAYLVKLQSYFVGK